MPILELQAITWCSVLMYLHRAAFAWLVLPTFAAGSDVSLVIKHDIHFVWVYLTGICGLMNLLFVPGHVVLTEHKVMFNFIYVYRSTALTL